MVARLGESIVDIAYLPPGATYRLGTAAVTAERDAEHQLGLVTLTLRRGFVVEQRVPRPGVTLRPVVYVLGSLAAHLIVWALAMTREPIEQVWSEPPRLRAVHVTREPSVPPPNAPAVASAAPTKRPRRSRASPPDDSVLDDGQRIRKFAGDVGKVLDKADIDPARGIYDEDAEMANGFGGGRRFDPAKSPAIMVADLATAAATAARRGDCEPARRNARKAEQLSPGDYRSIYLADADIASCLGMVPKYR